MQFEPSLVGPGALPLWLDVGSVALGAIYGATLATSRRAPLVGVLLLGILFGFGGGMIRDILLNTQINALVHGYYLTAVAISSIIGALIGDRIQQNGFLFTLLDSVVMGLFMVIGTEKAINYGMPTSSAIFIGVLTAVGGGIIGDLLTGELPSVMARGPWIASAATLGAISFVVLDPYFTRTTVELTAILLTIVIRMLSHQRGWEAPTPDDLKPSRWTKKTTTKETV